MICLLDGRCDMERYGAYADATGFDKTVMIGSLLSSVLLFTLSVVVMMVIGFFLGALVLTERIAQQCSDDEEQYTGQRAAGQNETYEEPERYEEMGGYEGVHAGVVIPRQAFSQAA